MTITNEKMLTISPNKTKQEEIQPDYYVEIFVPKKKEEQKTEKKVEKNNTGFPV